MAVIVEFVSYPTGRSSFLDAVPGMTLRHETIYFDCGGRLVWACWASGDEFEPFERGLEDDTIIDEWALLSQFEDRHLYELTLSSEPDRLVHSVIVELGIHILDREQAVDHIWTKLRCPSRDAYRAVRDRWTELHGNCRTHRLVEEGATGSSHDVLTPKQREVLTLAYERGYFKIPREVELRELSNDLNISETAVSQRIRRGLQELVRRECENGLTADAHVA